MAIPVSLVENKLISLPLEQEPFHVHVTIPFSLLVKDFDPNTTRVPEMERPPTDAVTKAVLVASPAYRYQVWPKLSVLLFGKEETLMDSVSGSDVEDWERAGDSNLFWACSTGLTDNGIKRRRGVVLKANHNPCSMSGIQFTVDKMGEKEKAAWKTAWRRGEVKWTHRGSKHEIYVNWALKACSPPPRNAPT